MRKLLLLLFLTSVFQLNAQSNKYEINSKVEIEAALETTDLNSIYNKVGVNSLGNGYYVLTSIKTDLRYDTTDYWKTSVSSYQRRGVYVEEISRSSFIFRENGQNKKLIKIVFIQKCKFKRNGEQAWYPMLTRSEAIEVASEIKNLLELGLLSQYDYDIEMSDIKYMLTQ